DCFDNLVGETIRNHDLDLGLWNKSHRTFDAEICLGWLRLLAETHDLRQVGAGDASLDQRVFDGFEFERLDDSDNAFHRLRGVLLWPGRLLRFAFRALGPLPKAFLAKQNLRQLCRCDLAANRTGKCERTRDGALKNGTALVPAGA